MDNRYEIVSAVGKFKKNAEHGFVGQEFVKKEGQIRTVRNHGEACREQRVVGYRRKPFTVYLPVLARFRHMYEYMCFRIRKAFVYHGYDGFNQPR